jgi:predicted RNA binding protein with dsRBD fold (UPF0201 family)
MTPVKIDVEAAVYPTESAEKIERAVRNILGEIALKQITRGDILVLEGHLDDIESLRHLKELLKRLRIRDATRAYLTRIARGDFLTFGLNKQAAYAGRVSFYHPHEAPMGPIQVTIKGDIDEVIRYLSERET